MPKKSELADATFAAKPERIPALMVVGHRKAAISSYRQASEMFEAARDVAMSRGMGPSDIPTPIILDSVGHVLGYVSWNGRVWPGMPRDPFDANRKPIYDNRADARR